MYLKGLKGRKKLKDIFIDLKIPREIRDSIPVIAVGNEVLVIPGIKDSVSYSLDDKTKNILKVKIEGEVINGKTYKRSTVYGGSN